MADNTKLLLVGGAAAAVWYFYFRTPAPVPPAAPSAPQPGGGVPTSPTSPAPVVPAPSPSVPTIATIEARTLAAANAPTEGLTIDEWDWFLNQQLAPLGKVAPDPVPLFNDLPGFVRSMPVTATTYWSRMEPVLRAQMGLSGFHGLGFFGTVQ
jgi:hypothetical protein